jgi:hypothetical protein
VTDVKVIANGATLIGTKLMRPITLHRCSGVTLQGLAVDYDVACVAMPGMVAHCCVPEDSSSTSSSPRGGGAKAADEK